MTRLGTQEPHTSRKSRKVGFYERPCICGHEYGAHAGADNRCTFRVIVGQVQTEVDDAETEERTCNLCPPCGFTETGGSYPGMWPAVDARRGAITVPLLDRLSTAGDAAASMAADAPITASPETGVFG